MKCPSCEREEKQHKIGKTKAGSQRYRCYVCHCNYTPAGKAAGYYQGLRQKAIQLYVDGVNLRRIGRELAINPQTVTNWVKRYAERLPAAPVPAKVQKAEMDELFTFIGNKKQDLPPNNGGSPNSLHFGLEIGLGTDTGESARLGG